MTNKTVKVTLRADVANYLQGMREASRATDDVVRGADNIDEWGDRYSAALEQVGGAAMIAGGLILTGLGLGAKAAMDWESSWTGVLKTVEGTPSQLAALEDGLRDLTGVLPASHAEIAAVAEAAGQLGIATPNVLEFTETMINLGETTNINAEEAAISLAQFMNIMGTAQEDVSNLGSAIVGLGNNFATTESDILDMATRIAGAGAVIGLTEGDVLGLATALSSVGIEADAGGSAISTVMLNISSAVDEGGDKLQGFADASMMSAEDFAAAWREDPAEALTMFIDGLANAEAQGKTANEVLNDLGITEIRMRTALLNASEASDLFAGSIAMGNEAFEENLALQEEAELRYGTTESKLGILRNRFTDMGIEVGAALLPALELAADGIVGIADTIGDMLDGPGGQFVAWGGLVVGSLLLLGGGIMTFIPQLAALNTALVTLGVSAGTVQGKLRNLFSLKGGIAITALWLALEAGKIALDAVTESADEATAAIQNSSEAADVLEAAMSRHTSIGEVFGWRDDAEEAAEIMEDLPGSIEKASGAFWETDQRGRELKQTFAELGELLAGMDPTEAADAFALFAENLPDDELVKLLDLMPAYRDELGNQAAGLGIVDGALDTNAEKLALAKWALEDAEGASGEFTDELTAQEQAAADAAAEIDALADAIRGLDDLMSSMVDSELNYYDALQKVDEALAENGATVDLNTEAGRNNREVLRDLAGAVTDYSADVLAMNGNQAEAAAIIENGRDAWIEQAELLGYTAEEAQALANEYFGIPGEVFTNVTDGGTIDATELSVEELQGQLDALPPNTFVEVTGLTDDAMQRLEDLGYTVTTMPDGEVYITASTSDAQGVLDEFIYVNSGRTIPVYIQYDQPIGPGLTDANGGLHSWNGMQSFANGGFPTGIYKGGPPIIKFAEPETRWEAFISGKPGQENRNIGIALEALRRLGYTQHYADGGMRDYANQMSRSPVVNVSAPAGGNTFEASFTVNQAETGLSQLERLVRRVVRTEMGR